MNIKIKVFEKEMQAAKDAALEASNTKSSFIANMSHELRTPLNAIIGYTEILSEDAEDRGDDAAVDDLNKINDAGKHLLQLINSILDLSKIESGKMELFIEQFKLNDFLKSIKSIATPLADKKGNQLVFDVEDGEIVISSDETKLLLSLFQFLFYFQLRLLRFLRSKFEVFQWKKSIPPLQHWLHKLCHPSFQQIFL